MKFRFSRKGLTKLGAISLSYIRKHLWYWGLFFFLTVFLVFVASFNNTNPFYADYIDPVTALFGLIVTVGITVILAAREWEEELPVELIVHFTYKDPGTGRKKYIYSCYGVNLLEGTDVRALSQQIGRQMNRELLQFNPSLVKQGEEIIRVLDEHGRKKWIKYKEIEVALDKDYSFRTGNRYKVWNVNRSDKEEKLCSRTDSPFHLQAGLSIETMLSNHPEAVEAFRRSTVCKAPEPRTPRLYILNSALIPSPGTYRYRHATVNEVNRLLDRFDDFTSAIGYESTARALSELLNRRIPYNRISIDMKPGDMAIVFKLRIRPREGQVFTLDEIRRQGYELGILEKL